MENSFFKNMVEEKGLYNKEIQVEYNNLTFYMAVANIVMLVEQASETKQEEIKNTMSKIDFHNGDIFHYLKFLALSYIKENYSEQGISQK